MINFKGNKLILVISAIMVFLMGTIYIAHHWFGVLSDYAFLQGVSILSPGKSILLYVLLLIPVTLLVMSFIVYKKNAESESLSLLLTLTFTFTSIGMIASGNGLVEYHFSIFMMLALISYFQSIKLIAISTVIFAVQHFAGYLFFPELLCGTSDYRFTLLMIHAVYLILSALANGVLILHTKRAENKSKIIRREAIQQYKSVVNQLRKTSSSILAVSSEVDNGAVKTEQVSINISGASMNLYKGAENLQDSVEKNVQYVENLLAIAEELNEGAQTVNNSAARTAENVQQGTDLIATAEKQFLTVKNSVDNLESLVMGFHAIVIEISRFVADISAISDQTNLLALNASIEAARAGDAGKGFAVVAGEVRKLASESEESADSIRKLVASIEKESEVIFNEMEVCVKEVENGTVSMRSSRDIFDVITISMEEVIGEMKNILNVSASLANDGAKMSASMEQMSSVSGESLNNSREIASSAELQFTSVEALTDMASKLRTQSGDLEELVREISDYERETA
ncbi:methyl-accepting chemotaxis protein [Sporosarcina limicola]|uniref:Methyl-accepting chemotaxis protein n=1 Tax=Sporosarcina limicola TaxID=34101 RepID=A0A927RFV6_9BACL|nr:methyl-accepting chemotaxis protein [Sporosarcina limicola]MBE1555917.1 methyl-accepting chemotaxis protein [Sporosarcina limicola]